MLYIVVFYGKSIVEKHGVRGMRSGTGFAATPYRFLVRGISPYMYMQINIKIY